MNDFVSLVGLGGAIGLVASLVGGWLSYWFYLRKNESELTTGPVALILIITGLLVMVGVIALIVGAISGHLDDAVMVGIGVFLGFSLGFFGLLYGWTRRNSHQA